MPLLNINLRLRVKHSGVLTKTVSKELSKVKNEQNVNLHAIAKKTAESIATFIHMNTKKGTGKKGLSDYFKRLIPKVRRIGTNFYVSIGNAQELNQEHPYWRFLNYGGHFLANQPARQERFIPGRWTSGGFKYDKSSKKGFTLTEKSYLKGINYLEHGEFILSKHINEILRNYKATRKFTAGGMSSLVNPNVK